LKVMADLGRFGHHGGVCGSCEFVLDGCGELASCAAALLSDGCGGDAELIGGRVGA
jgi:hypothetical protein